MRRRIFKSTVTDESIILTLAKLYNVAFKIAQRFYNKANGDLKQAKAFLSIYTFNPQIV